MSSSISPRAWAVVWLAASTCASFAHGADTAARDEAAIRQAGRDYLAALARGDRQALTEFWTAEGTYVDDSGRSVKVRELLSEASVLPGGTLAASSTAEAKVRFVADNVAIEEGEVVSPAVDGESPARCRYAALWVREGGKWKLDNVRETGVEPLSGPEQLASLDIFAGDWSGERNGIAIRVAAAWDANKKFLRREISMTSGKASLAATQEIGWDPLTGQVRSWLFGDDGSRGEGFWSMEGNRWMVRSSRVLFDGTVSTATQVYRFPDKDTLVWKLIDGSIDGQPTDDFEVTLKRAGG